jgi:ankyrin repeat protein
MIIRRILITAFLSAVVLIAACNDTEGPKKILEQRGIAFTTESFFSAVVAGETDVVDLFLRGAMPVDTTDPDGLTALMLASSKDDVSMIALLLGKGASVRAVTNNGDTALMMAAARGNYNAVQLLLSAGAEPNAANSAGMTPLFFAVSSSSVKTYPQNRHFAVADLLITKGADVNAAEKKHGQTPLMIAAAQGDVEMLKRLIAAKADVNQQSSIGFTPLMYAVVEGNKTCVDILLKNGARVTHRSANGVTPLQLAERLKQNEIAVLLRSASRQ